MRITDLNSRIGNLGFVGQLDLGLRLGARHYFPFLAIALVVDVPLAIAGVAGDRTDNQVVSFLLGLPLIALVNPIGKAAVIVAVSRTIEGLPPSPIASYSVIVRRILPIMVASVIWIVAVGLGIVALVVPGLMLLILGQCLMGSIVVDGLGPIAAARQSWRFVWPAFWATLGVFLFIELGGSGLAVPIDFLLGLVAEPGGWWDWIAAVISRAIFSPFAYAIFAVLFLDLRARGRLTRDSAQPDISQP